MIGQKEAQKIVDSLAPGITVTVVTVQEPTHTFDVHGKPSPRLDKDGTHIRHPVTSLHMTLGHVTCSFDFLVGAGSAHEREPRTYEESVEVLKRQVANLVIEATRKPFTPDEYKAWQIEQLRINAQRNQELREQRALEERAAMTDSERAAADYHAEYGEPDFFMHEHLEHHEAHLAAAVSLGAMTEERAAAERERIAAWKQRCEARLVKENV